MYTTDMIELKEAIYSAKLEQLAEQDEHIRSGVNGFVHSHILGSYDDTEIEPLDEYYHERKSTTTTNEPLPF